MKVKLTSNNPHQLNYSLKEAALGDANNKNTWTNIFLAIIEKLARNHVHYVIFVVQKESMLFAPYKLTF